MSSRTFKTNTGGGTTVTNVAVPLDDFTNWNKISAPGTTNDNYGASGNFICQNEDTQNFNSTITSEPNHPGIVKLSVSTGGVPFGDHLIGFGLGTGTLPSGSDYLLSFDNDFDIEAECRLTYTNPGFQAFFLFQNNVDTLGILIRDGFVEYALPGGGYNVTAVAAPANTAWFKLRWVYSAGVLTITLDGATVFTGAVGLTGGFQTDFFPAPGSFVQPDLEVDYVLTNYNVTR